MQRPIRVSLALGSGGARGYAHVGAIQVIEERGLRIGGVAGSSMGALIGGLHAAGTLPDYAEWAVTLTRLQVLRMLEISRTSGAALSIDKVFARMHELLAEVRIEDLPIPYTAVATDLLARSSVWFQRGPLEAAVRASIAIPGLFPPTVVDGRVLVDGGVLDPVPMAATASMPADVTIAVCLNGDRGSGGGEQALPESVEPSAWAERIRLGASTLLATDAVRSLRGLFAGPGGAAGPADDGPGGTGAEGPDAHGPAARPASSDAQVRTAPAEPDPEAAAPLRGLGSLDVMNLSFDAMQALVTRFRLAGHPPDVLVTVPKDSCRSIDFHRAAEMIALGRTLTTEALDRAGVPPDAGDPSPQESAAPSSDPGK